MAEADDILMGLDPEQRDVATTLHGPLVVLAGAGTGKTRAITHRIAYGVATGTYDPRQVLAVTFTTRAAGELRHRLGVLGAPRVQARTFHSAALSQARYFWPRVHRGDLPPLVQNRMALVADAARRLRLGSDPALLRDLSGEISWAKVSNLTPERYSTYAIARGRTAGSLEPAAVAKVFEGYEELKRERERIDFEDILLCAASLLADHPEIAAEFARTYRWFVVDEYQDVSPLQQALLTLWRGDREDLCVVGDPAQTIHSFAGARSDYLTGFASRHPGARTIELVRNYRSTPEVVGLANAVMRRARGGSQGESEAVTLRAQRPTGTPVVHADHPDEGTEARTVADWLVARHDDGVAWRDMAVLFRVNSQSPSYEAALADRGVPYLIRGAERFYDRPEVRQGLLLVRAESRTDPGADPRDRVRVLLGGVGWTAEPPTGAGAVRERWESLAALVQLVDDQVTDHPGITLAEVSEELSRRADAKHVPTADAVTFSTLHSAKGLEWEAVALVGVQEGTLPFVLASTPEQITEERRLLYVGITRARRHLHLSWSRSRSGGDRRRRSRFLDGLAPDDGAVSSKGSSPAGRTTTKPRRTVQVRNCRSCGQVLHSGTEFKLGRHADCPATYDENLLEQLRSWRSEEAGRAKLPAFCVLTDATLTALAEAQPADSLQLLRIQGLGKVKVDRYGGQVLQIITDHLGSSQTDQNTPEK